MIDEKVFRDTWALLCDRFGRQPSTPLMLAYYKTLSGRMSTEQFRAAAQRVFEAREFFPRPADFLEITRPDVAAESLEQWEAVQKLMRGDGGAGLNEESRRVVRMLGGEAELRRSNLDNLPFIRRDFMQLYGQAATIAHREAGERIEPTPESARITAGLMPIAGQKSAPGLRRIGGQ